MPGQNELINKHNFKLVNEIGVTIDVLNINCYKLNLECGMRGVANLNNFIKNTNGVFFTRGVNINIAFFFT